MDLIITVYKVITVEVRIEETYGRFGFTDASNDKYITTGSRNF